jgi:hypothetical protein
MKTYDARTLLYNYVSDAKMMLDNHVPSRKVVEVLRKKILKLERKPKKTDYVRIRWDDETETGEEEEQEEKDAEE